MQLKPEVKTIGYTDLAGNNFIRHDYEYKTLPFNTNVNRFKELIDEKAAEQLWTNEVFVSGNYINFVIGDCMTVIVSLHYRLEKDENEELY